MPFLWYFYSALPRALLSSIFLIPVGLFFNSRVRVLVIPSIFYVILFSFLPHKELRFIFYVLPLLNAIAATGADYVWKMRGKSFIRAIISVSIIFHLVLNSVASVGFLIASHKNYPGGNALMKLQEIEKRDNVNVHIDVYSAQTGVSRFLELNPTWK